MSNFDLTPTPNYVVMALRGNSGAFDSPLIASQQVVDRGGLHWLATYTYTEARSADRGELLGTIASLRGQAHRLIVPVYDNEAGGAYGGTPLVNGASQTGSTLNINGCSTSITNWIRKGDYFSVDVNGVHELKMATANSDSDGSGNVTLSFEPRLRFSPLDNAVIYVQDGVLPRPRGVFMLTEPEQNWSSRPGENKRSAISLNLTEDMLASAP